MKSDSIRYYIEVQWSAEHRAQNLVIYGHFVGTEQIPAVPVVVIEGYHVHLIEIRNLLMTNRIANIDNMTASSRYLTKYRTQSWFDS
jgi:hypothetical protein